MDKEIVEGDDRDGDKGDAPFEEGGGYGAGRTLGLASGRGGHVTGSGTDIQGGRELMLHCPC